MFLEAVVCAKNSTRRNAVKSTMDGVRERKSALSCTRKSAERARKAAAVGNERRALRRSEEKTCLRRFELQRRRFIKVKRRFGKMISLQFEKWMTLLHPA